MSKNEIIAIIPAYNEGKSIGAVLKRIPEGIDCVVIDDCSNDNTTCILKENNISYLRNDSKKGVSYCLKRGISFAKKMGYEHVITLDADGQHAPELINMFKKNIYTSDFVIANRFFDVEKVPTIKLTSNCFASKLVKQYLQYVIPDVSCGYRAYQTADLFEHLNSVHYYEYEMVYEVLFWNIKNSRTFELVNTPSIYFPFELWCTQRSEVLSLLRALNKHVISSELKHILNGFETNSITRCTVDQTVFWFHYYPENDAYFIQADVQEILGYYKEINNV